MKLSLRGGAVNDSIATKKMTIEEANFSYFTCRETPILRLNVHAYI
jgi:hypothetical protein